MKLDTRHNSTKYSLVLSILTHMILNKKHLTSVYSSLKRSLETESYFKQIKSKFLKTFQQSNEQKCYFKTNFIISLH
jgi:hypothetical protein